MMITGDNGGEEQTHLNLLKRMFGSGQSDPDRGGFGSGGSAQSEWGHSQPSQPLLLEEGGKCAAAHTVWQGGAHEEGAPQLLYPKHERPHNSA